MVPRPSHRRPRAIEWPTVAVAVAIYSGWLALTWWHDALPLPLVFVAGGWLVAWHGSLQHETIHGHPTPWPWVNGALGFAPLSLWLPYDIYRRSHLAHHAAAPVTCPHADPESRYLPAGSSQAARLVARVQATLAGRLIVGPLLTTAVFLRSQITPGDLRQGLRDWLPHVAAAAIVLGWLKICGMGLGYYIMVFVYPGTALTLLRSYAEHRADAHAGRRAAVVEDSGLLSILFLHNNLHAAHHLRPALAWYRLPAFYRGRRDAILRRNGGLFYRGYGDVARRFLTRPHDQIEHPNFAGVQ